MIAGATKVSLRDLFTPHPKQIEYIQATDKYKFVLFGGARGPGKSYSERWRQVRFLLKLSQLGLTGVQTGLFSTTFKESRKRQFLPAKEEFPQWLGSFNESNLEFKFAPEYGGHRIAFLNLEDVSQYKSDQFATIGIEEITQCASWDTITRLTGSLRWPGVNHSPLCATTNPDGPLHSVVKGLWVDETRKLFKHPDYKRLNPDQFHFVRALPSDNPSLPESYITEVLEGLPPTLRKAWLEGSWDLFDGQRFEINPDVHIVEPFDFQQRHPNAYYFASMDVGFHNPFACGIYATLPGVVRPDIYKIREINQAGLSRRDQARLVLSTLKEMNITLKGPAWLDPSAWQEKDEGLSIADTFRQEGLPVREALNARPAGWNAIEGLLEYSYGSNPDDPYEIAKESRLKIFSTCVMTIQQLTDAIWDPKKPGDIMHPESFRDDSLDETRYFALSHLQKPKEADAPSQFDWMKRAEKHMKKVKRR